MKQITVSLETKTKRVQQDAVQGDHKATDPALPKPSVHEAAHQLIDMENGLDLRSHGSRSERRLMRTHFAAGMLAWA